MKKIFALTSAFIIITIVPAYAINVSQRWDKTYDLGYLSQAFSIQQTLDGGYIVVGSEFAVFLVLKLDCNGDIVWQNTYEDGFALSVQQTSDGGYIVAGWTTFGGSLVLRLDSAGSIIWQKIFHHIYHVSIIQTYDGGFIMSGGKGHFPEGAIVAIKLNANGDISWQNKYPISVDPPHSEYKVPIKQTSDGGYIIAIGDGNPNVDVWFLKLDSNGNISWLNTYGAGIEWDYALSIEETLDAGFIVAGGTHSVGAGENDFWILKLDSSGEVIWQKTYGGESADYATSIKQTPDGGYIVVGNSSSFGGYENLWILKLDSTGDVSWQKIYLERRSGYQPTVGLTADGGYVISSQSSNPPTYDWKIWVLKLDSNGEIPDCEVLSITDAVVADTTISPEESDVIVSPLNVIVTDQDRLPQGTSANISSICQYNDSLDTDGDGVENNLEEPMTTIMSKASFLGEDNCSEVPNGLFLGTCTRGNIGSTCIANEACGVDGICSMYQEDSYPPQGNGIGDACDCEGDFNCDGDCDGTDAAAFKIDFGRNSYNTPCESGNSCNGDFDCDNDCDGTDAAKFKVDFGRNGYNNPCPTCTQGEWCNYPLP